MRYEESQTVFPVLAMGYDHEKAAEPVMLEGMRVLFDQKVGLYPVTLMKKEEEPGYVSGQSRRVRKRRR